MSLPLKPLIILTSRKHLNDILCDNNRSSVWRLIMHLNIYSWKSASNLCIHYDEDGEVSRSHLLISCWATEVNRWNTRGPFSWNARQVSVQICNNEGKLDRITKWKQIVNSISAYGREDAGDPTKRQVAGKHFAARQRDYWCHACVCLSVCLCIHVSAYQFVYLSTLVFYF